MPHLHGSDGKLMLVVQVRSKLPQLLGLFGHGFGGVGQLRRVRVQQHLVLDDGLCVCVCVCVCGLLSFISLCFGLFSVRATCYYIAAPLEPDLIILLRRYAHWFTVAKGLAHGQRCTHGCSQWGRSIDLIPGASKAMLHNGSNAELRTKMLCYAHG